MDDIDLTQKTLFIFPGLEVTNAIPEWKDYQAGADIPIHNGVPSEPYHAIEDKFERQRIATAITHCDKMPRTGHLINLLERGVSLTDAHDFTISNVVLCTYDDAKANEMHLKNATSDERYSSQEALRFTGQLYNALPFTKRAIDPSKITLLGWSYGTSFMQQIATAMQSSHSEDISKIHAIGVSCTADINTMMRRGFPGLYMYGLNDTIIPKFITNYQDGFLKSALEVHMRKDNGEVVKKKFDPATILSYCGEKADQVFLLNNVPTHVCRIRHLPKGKMKNGQTFISQPDFLNESGHAPGAAMEAAEGSYFIDEKGNKVGMFEHSNVFRRATDAILSRSPEHTVSCNAMLNVENLDADHKASALHARGIIEVIDAHTKREPDRARSWSWKHS